MKIERDERKFDFHDIGLAIKKAREREGLTQEQLAFIVDRDTRTIMYHENDGQHPSLNVFYQLTTMFGISVDQFFYPEMGADEATVKRINIMLQSLNESELRIDRSQSDHLFLFVDPILLHLRGLEQGHFYLACSKFGILTTAYFCPGFHRATEQLPGTEQP